jgi:membrane protein DedA with SNARE-associated domain
VQALNPSDVFSWMPRDFAEWMPLWQASIFFVATFILEDVATIGAGLLLALGAVAWPTAFWACFLGVWMGDAGLYALARCGGRSWFDRSRLRRFRGRVLESEMWFAQRGTPILVFSRMLPGARLPTYLAAGFLRVPLNRFLLVTGLASLGWTIAVLIISQLVGTKVLAWFGVFKNGTWLLLASLVTAWCSLPFGRRFFTAERRQRISARFGRWRHWEFWPAWMFYLPVAIYCVWLSIKYRGLTLPTSANPGIFSGGMVGESKMATLNDLMVSSSEFVAEAELISGSTAQERLGSIHDICRRRQISHPFILKPDVGQRGAGIKLIRTEEQAMAYLSQTDAPLVLQRYAPGPHEIGVFYYRFPHEAHGHIFAITQKIFPILTGDGRSTIRELIWRDPRARYMADKYLHRFAGREDEVLPQGERLKLVEAGNHAQGCVFRDGMHLCTPALLARVNAISQKLVGFYIGRYDIRYSSEEELRAGENFQIIELNGAASEATSIYDSRNSLFDAYRTLFRQWDLVFAIGAANRRRGCAPTKLRLVWKTWRDYCHQAVTYPAAD